MNINIKIKYIFMAGLLIVVSGIVYYYVFNDDSVGEDEVYFCTMDVFMCPDGSYVGRTGRECLFSACPNKDFFVGELRRSGEGYKLIMEAPKEAINSATYSMPLNLKTTNIVGQLLGQKVKVRGTFLDGAVLNVDLIEEVAPEESGWKPYEGIVGVGETKLIEGIKITLNSVVQDSRCPVDAECIEGGAITANVTFMSDTDKETFNMPSDEVPRNFDAWQVSIIGVRPSRISAKDPDPNSYQVIFRVENLPENR